MPVPDWVVVLLPAGAAVVLAGAWAVVSLVRARQPAGAIRLAPPTTLAAADLAALRSFSERDFQARLTEVYSRVAGAWRDRRLPDLEPYVTTDLLAAWTAGPGASGAPPPLAVAPDDVHAIIIEAMGGGGYEHVTVRLDERRGDRPAMQFWTFERGSRGATTGRTCPACDASLVLDERGRCASCGATIDLGRPAWVLARIESAKDWSTRELAPHQAALETLDAIAAADTTFDPDVFTERIGALYPHLAQAIRDPSCALAQVAIAPRLRERLAGELAAPARSGWRAVVDSVEVSGVAISAAFRFDARDSITVTVSATAAEYALDGAGRLLSGDREPHRVFDRWTFQRPEGVTTRSHGGVLAEVCPRCGAPIELDGEGRCRHCAAAVTLGQQDWVLVAAGTTVARLHHPTLSLLSPVGPHDPA
jgi:uncharacterized Zn finger protein (UPF0148 family)